MERDEISGTSKLGNTPAKTVEAYYIKHNLIIILTNFDHLLVEVYCEKIAGCNVD